MTSFRNGTAIVSPLVRFWSWNAQGWSKFCFCSNKHGSKLLNKTWEEKQVTSYYIYIYIYIRFKANLTETIRCKRSIKEVFKTVTGYCFNQVLRNAASWNRTSVTSHVVFNLARRITCIFFIGNWWSGSVHSRSSVVSSFRASDSIIIGVIGGGRSRI